MSRFRWPLLAVFALLAGCINLAPEYERPQAPVAEQWLPGATPKGQVAADIQWQQFFTDSRLSQLQTLALANNRDLRVASLNIEKAQSRGGPGIESRRPAGADADPDSATRRCAAGRRRQRRGRTRGCCRCRSRRCHGIACRSRGRRHAHGGSRDFAIAGRRPAGQPGLLTGQRRPRLCACPSTGSGRTGVGLRANDWTPLRAYGWVRLRAKAWVRQRTNG